MPHHKANIAVDSQEDHQHTAKQPDDDTSVPAHEHPHTHSHLQVSVDSHAHAHTHHHTHHQHQSHHVLSNDKKGPRILTVRALSGLSGDMMVSGLSGLLDLCASDMDNLVAELNLPALNGCVSIVPRQVNQINGIGCTVTLPSEHTHRTLSDIVDIIAASKMPEDTKLLSIQTFTLLAEAEAHVHGKETADITFHEVGALDSILDICLVCRLFTMLAPERFICSPLPLADGMIACAHGLISSPAPAVLQMLDNVAVCGFTGYGETVTPTALSLLKTLGAAFGKWPAMTVQKTIISYGTKVFTDAPNGAIWAMGTSMI